MAQYEEEHIEFAILSLVKDPLLNFVPALASNVKSILAVTLQLDKIKPDWRHFILTNSNEHFAEDSYLTTPDAAYGLEQQDIDEAPLLTEDITASLTGHNAAELLALHQKLVTEQARLRTDIREEMQATQADEMKATSRSQDQGAKLQNFSRRVKAKERERT